MISHDTLAEFSAFLWPAMVGHIWQASIIAGLCFLSLPAFRSAGAKARHALWALAFVRFAIPQDLLLFADGRLGLQVGSAGSLGNPLQRVSLTVAQVTQPSLLTDYSSTGISSAPAGHREIYCILTVTWIAGCLLLLARSWYLRHKFAKLLQMPAREGGTEILESLESLRGRMGVRRRAKLRVTWRGSEPGVYGVWRPILVFPEEMLRQLSPSELESVLAHELIHVARWDNLWSNLQMLVCCIFWFNPVVWILDRCLIAEREHSCDERVVGALRNSQAYASGLIKMAGIGLGLRVAGVSPMAGANLKRRIENMKKTNRRTGMPARILLSSISVVTVLFYLVAAPVQKSAAATSNLVIENSENSPLQIVSASVADLSAPTQRTSDVTAHLVKPKIVLKNVSDRPLSVYVIEFRKAGSVPFYLTRTDLDLAPKAADSIETNSPNTFLYSAEDGKVAGEGVAWAVRVDTVRFKDGKVVALHGSPIPPPPAAGEVPVPGKRVPGGVVGGMIARPNGPVPPPPPPAPQSPPLIQKPIAVDGDVQE